MIEFNGYKCEYCGKLYQTKHHCKNHEENKCTRNPKNWDKCIGCIYSQQYQDTIDIKFPDPVSGGYGMLTDEKQVTKYQCLKLKKQMYPFKAKSKGYVNKYPDTFGELHQMPNECDHFKDNEPEDFRPLPDFIKF